MHFVFEYGVINPASLCLRDNFQQPLAIGKFGLKTSMRFAFEVLASLQLANTSTLRL
jgi:hypothetical protein